MELREFNRFSIAGDSAQGLDTDGTFLVESSANSSTPDAYLRIYDYTGYLLSTRNCTNDGTNTHLGDLCVVGTNIYVTCSNYPNTPYNTKVKKYSFLATSPYTISYVTEYDLGDNEIGEGIDWDGTNFWTAYDNSVVKKWDTGFTNPTTYVADFVPTPFKSTHGFQTLRFDTNGSLWSNVHDGSWPPVALRYWVDHTNHTLELQEAYTRPKTATQGLTFNGSDVIMVERVYGSDPDAIVFCKLVPADHRDKVIKGFYDSATLTSTSTNYAEATSTKTDIKVEKDDIVRAELQGEWYVVGSTNIRAKLEVSGASPVSASLTHTVPSIRVRDTNSDGTSGTHIAYFKAAESGTLVIAMWWMVSTTSGSASGKCFNKSIDLQIVGKDTD